MSLETFPLFSKIQVASHDTSCEKNMESYGFPRVVLSEDELRELDADDSIQDTPEFKSMYRQTAVPQKKKWVPAQDKPYRASTRMHSGRKKPDEGRAEQCERELRELQQRYFGNDVIVDWSAKTRAIAAQVLLWDHGSS